MSRRVKHKTGIPPKSPQQQPQKKTETTKAVVQKQEFSGPLPPPNTLGHYEQIHPGAADRIIAMAESQSVHRQELEKFVVTGNIKQALRGQVFGLIVGLTAIIGGVYCVIRGYTIGGSVIGGGGLTGLVSVFVIGKWKSSKELERKAQQ